jgi:hypothetical protein
LGKSLGLGIALKAFDNVKTGKDIFVEPELVQPAFFKMFADFAFEFGVTLQELVTLVEAERAEGGKGVENLGFLFCARRAGCKGPVEVAVPDDERARVVATVGGMHSSVYLRGRCPYHSAKKGSGTRLTGL